MVRQIPVASADEPGPGQRKLVFIDGRSVVLFNIDGELVAIENACPHHGASLAHGQLEGYVLRCPAHGLRLDLRDRFASQTTRLCPKGLPVRASGGKVELVIEGPAETA